MSISSISNAAPTFQPPPQNNIRQNFQQLSQALQSGDLSGAQQAYATLLQNLPNQGANGSSNSNNPFQQAIASIGSALQSGDVSSAQQALQQLQGQMKGAHHHHHHGGGQQSVQASNSSTATDSSLVSSTDTSSATSVSLYA